LIANGQKSTAKFVQKFVSGVQNNAASMTMTIVKSAPNLVKSVLNYAEKWLLNFSNQIMVIHIKKKPLLNNFC